MRYTVRAPGSLGACLGRLLAEASGRTRKQMLAGGRVRVNGATARNADTALAAAHAPRVLVAMITADAATLGRATIAREAAVKVVLVQHKQAVAALLRALTA